MKTSKDIANSLILFSLTILVTCGLMITIRETSKTESSNPVPRANRNQSLPALPGTDAIAHLKQSGQFESLGAAVTAAGYEAGQSDGNAFATNYANQIRSTFSPAGLLIESSDPGAKWQMRWC